MEVVDPAEQARHQHKWLQWLGLQEPPADAEAWVAVARGFHLDAPQAGTSRLAGQLVAVLGRANIDARQRLYQFYDVAPGGIMPGTGMETCVAVVVHERDLTRAVDLANSARSELDEESEEPLSGELFDDELTRQALAAGPPPPD